MKTCGTAPKNIVLFSWWRRTIMYSMFLSSFCIVL
jgi:hypothetical protein